MASQSSVTDSQTVTVVGAGIVGTWCAIYLQRLGFKVTLIDRIEPGQACSFGNAGVISSWSCTPDSVPGIAYSVPGGCWILKGHWLFAGVIYHGRYHGF